MTRLVNRGLNRSVAALCVLVSVTSQAAPRYELQVSRSQARDSLLGILDDLNARSSGMMVSSEDRELLSHATSLIRSYRTSSAPLPVGTLTIASAPYLGLIIGQKIGDLYPAAYEARHSQEYAKIVEHPKLEFILDRFLEAYLSGSLPPALQKSASGLGGCLARKAMNGKGANCPLDESDSIHKPSTFLLAAAKFTCFLPRPTACSTRQLIFNAAKADLLNARATKALAGPFEEAFPKKFREGLLSELNETRANLGSLVSRKFRGELTELWNDQTPLIEGGEGAAGQMSLHEFASGLRADLMLGARLAHSEDAQERGMSAALFYAAANRLLVLSGGQAAETSDTGFTLDPDDHFDSAKPKAPPHFHLRSFGGWSVRRVGAPGETPGGVSAFSPWDWAAYDPTAKEHPSDFRVFPSEFLLGPRGVPVSDSVSIDSSESLGDLADVLAALSEFLKATRVDGVFGSHFGSAQALDQILDPDRPVIFPKEGRLLAIGAMAGVLKNLVAPGLGHLELTVPGSISGGLGLAFHDRVSLRSRDQSGATTLGVAKALVAAAELRNAIQGDADIPAELLAYTPQLDSALQIGALTLGAQAQTADGGFNDHLKPPLGPAPAIGPRTLVDAIQSLRALSFAYSASQILVLRLSLRLGWRHLDQFWPTDGVIPHAAEGTAVGQPGSLIHPGELWTLVRLWDESQRVVRQDLATDLDWVKWERRIAGIRQALLDQLRSDHGPEPFLE